MVKIGVYICHCGVNIRATVDVERVAKFAGQLDNVVIARDYAYMCSDPGQALIKKDIDELGLNRVVVAACSPLMHQSTFRRVVESAGLNPYLFEMANIREQCSWVHKDREMATKKAMAIVASSIARASLLNPLKEKEVDVIPSALVVGGGIAGIQSSLDIANAGFNVHLVEKEPSIGGRMAQLDKTFPTLDCSACILTPKMTEVGEHPNIKLYTYSEVEEFSGYFGNFKVKIKKKTRYVDEEKCTGCGDCWTNCPVRNRPQILEVPSIAPMIEKEVLAKLNEIIDRYNGQAGVEIPILQDINLEFHYLPKDALMYVAERLEVPVSRLYEIATFFTDFSLEPRGKYLIKVCMGTACFVRGAEIILDKFSETLGIEPGETTKDLRFTLSPVRCLGCCSIAPAIMIDNKAYGRIELSQIPRILGKYK